MKLTAAVEWHPSLPYSHIDSLVSPEKRDTMNVFIHLEDQDECLRPFHEGKISLQRETENYLGHLILSYDGFDKQLTELGSGNKGFYIPLFTSESEGKKELVLEANSQHHPGDLKRVLKKLTTRYDLAVRDKENLNNHDYWHGFFGTSNNLWSDSRYPRGTIVEKATQLAYELEQGIRENDREIWFFPGYFEVFGKTREMLSEHNLKVVDDLNDILKNSQERKPDEVATDLRGLASEWQAA